MRVCVFLLSACGTAPTPPADAAGAEPPAPSITDAACIPRAYTASPVTYADESDTQGFVCFSIVGDASGAAEEVATLTTRTCFAVDARGALVEQLSPAEVSARAFAAPESPKVTLTGDRAKVCMPNGLCREVAISRGPRADHERLDYPWGVGRDGRYLTIAAPQHAGEIWAELYDMNEGARLGRMKLSVPEAANAFTNRDHTRVLQLVGRGVVVSELAKPEVTAFFDIVGGKARYLHGDSGVWIQVNDQVIANRRGDTLELIDVATLATRATVRSLGSEVPHFFQGTVRKVGDTVLFYGENPPNVTVIDARTLRVSPPRAFRLCDPADPSGPTEVDELGSASGEPAPTPPPAAGPPQAGAHARARARPEQTRSRPRVAVARSL